MAEFTGKDDLEGARFLDADLSRARFVGADLSGVVMRGVQIENAEIDAPWLFEGECLRVNGVNVIPLVDAELNRRFPGRAERNASDPEGLRSAWAALEQTWAATLERAATLSPEALDRSVDGEWSFAQTLRHLILATDMWLGRGVREIEHPFHPLGLVDVGSAEEDGFDLSVFATETPTYDQILEARADRVAMVRDFIGSATPEQLVESRKNPHNPAYPETVLNCLHVILEEEWEHHRYAVRDLDVIEAATDA